MFICDLYKKNNWFLLLISEIFLHISPQSPPHHFSLLFLSLVSEIFLTHFSSFLIFILKLENNHVNIILVEYVIGPLIVYWYPLYIYEWRILKVLLRLKMYFCSATATDFFIF